MQRASGEPEGLACPNSKVPHLWCDSHTSFKVKRSRSPGPLMLSHIVHCILRTAKPMNFKLGVRMEDNDPHQPQAPWLQRSRLQGHVISLSRLGPMLYLSLEATEGIPCQPNPAATLLVIIIIINVSTCNNNAKHLYRQRFHMVNS